ncbi:MAG: CinA family nicotinamide mononucleotide deamidase-related protein [Planctomycetes bacterium]|nr:CinA family nicotinamide mononucleotide deamidase-related protein [Planctomycetota bacterium]
MARRACIIAVGNEVVHGFIVNTNSAWLARELGELGFDVAYHLSVNDRQDELTARLKAALSEGLFIVTTGGIGPTVDDNTRQSVAAALGVELKLDHDALAKLSERYAAVGRKFPQGSERQCKRPEGSKFIANAFGTASCFLARHGEGGIAVLPGVPRELKGIWAEELRAAVIEEFGLHERFFSRELRVFGIPESDLDLRVKSLLESKEAEGAILVDDAVMRLRWRVAATEQADADKILVPILDAARAELGDLVFAEGNIELETCTVDLLREKQLKVACAESCTGGMIAHLLTNVAGSSDVLLESAVTYSNDAKQRRLGVSAGTLKSHGAVSGETASEMVRGIQRESGADICVAVTGIAGPGGGSDAKPVGTVWLAAAMANEVRAWHLRVPGERELVKWRTARTALNTLRLAALHGKLPETIAHWVAPPA